MAYIQPGLLFVGPTKAQERQFLGNLFSNLSRKYTAYAEPCVGSFAMAQIAKAAGFDTSAMYCSDVTLYSSLLGCLLCDDLAFEDLGIIIDGEVIRGTGDDVTDVADVLWWQETIRTEQKPDVPYWNEIRKAYQFREGQMKTKLKKQLAKLRDAMGGLYYEPGDIWDHADAVASEGHMVLYAAPPSYGGGYEKFYDSQGRIMWNEPEYAVFDPNSGVREFLERYRNAEALMVILEERPMGNESGPPVYARRMGGGRCTYVLSNRPDEVYKLTGLQAVDKGGWQVTPLDAPILPPDYPIHPKCKVWVSPIAGENAMYYRDLWMHKIDYKPAHNEFAVFIDGYLAGIAGYDTRAVNLTFAEKWSDALILTYAVGAPHDDVRLTKLVTQLAMLRSTVDLVVPAWAAVQTKQVMTTAFTRYPESKGLRGVMKLVEKVEDKKYGYRLVYAAPVKDGDAKRMMVRWLQKS